SFLCSTHPRTPPSFPTRRSSDLARTQSVLYALGDCPLDNDGFTTLIETLNLEAGCGPLVANRAVTGDADWPLPKVQQLIVVPMRSEEHTSELQSRFGLVCRLLLE